MSACPSKGPEKERPRFRVQDVFQRHGPSFRAARRLSLQNERVLEDLMSCRTAALGGHLYECDACGQEVPVYNSCCNRHCPTCGTLRQENWTAQRKAELLPVQYFHAVFTVPHALNGLALANKAVVYGLLFDAVAQTLLAFGEERLEGTLGLINLFHTWDQLLGTHLHIHSIIPGGALSKDGPRWNRPLKEDILFPVEDLSPAYRDRFLKSLEAAHEGRELHLPAELASLKDEDAFQEFLRPLSEQYWTVWLEPSLVGPEHAIEYLSRYTNRVAISDSRIVEVTDDSVTICYKDRRRKENREHTFEAHEFLALFLNHTLPQGFHRIRYYGLFSNPKKGRLLPAALFALNHAPVVERPPDKTPEQFIRERTGEDVTRCPHCREGRLRYVRAFSPLTLQPAWRGRMWFSGSRSPPIGAAP